MSDSKHVKSADVSEDHKVSESSSEHANSNKPKVQFSVLKLMLWTSTVGVGLAISTQAENGPVVFALFMSCLGLLCGFSISSEHPRRMKEIWFPVGMLLLIPIGFSVGAIGGVNSSGVGNDILAAFGALGAIGAVVYGLVLLVRFVGWTQRHGFSLRLLALWLTCWMWFMLGTLFALIGGLGAFWS